MDVVSLEVCVKSRRRQRSSSTQHFDQKTQTRISVLTSISSTHKPQLLYLFNDKLNRQQLSTESAVYEFIGLSEYKSVCHVKHSSLATQPTHCRYCLAA
jgi:hypothetical protein